MKLYGSLENSVKTEVWNAVSTYVLIAIMKRLKINLSLCTILQILSITLFEKMTIYRDLTYSGYSILIVYYQKQMNYSILNWALAVDIFN